MDLLNRILGAKKEKSQPRLEEGEVKIALCVLLLEAAHSDGACSKEEMEHVITTLVTRYGVARKDVEALVESGYQRRDEAVDLFSFTRYLNKAYSKQERIQVMESVWRVIHTDGRLEAHEDHFAHKLANLLRLTHKELITAKIAARHQLREGTL